MAIIESEMNSHSQLVLSNLGQQPWPQGSRTDRFCQGQQMLWEKWGFQGDPTINDYDMRYWINFNTNMKSQKGFHHYLLVHFVGNMPRLKSAENKLLPVWSQKYLTPFTGSLNIFILRLLTDNTHSKLTLRQFPFSNNSQAIPILWLLLVSDLFNFPCFVPHQMTDTQSTLYFVK